MEKILIFKNKHSLIYSQICVNLKFMYIIFSLQRRIQLLVYCFGKGCSVSRLNFVLEMSVDAVKVNIIQNLQFIYRNDVHALEKQTKTNSTNPIDFIFKI